MNEDVTEQPPVAVAEQPPVAVEQPPAAPVDEDVALDAALDEQAIEVPDGDKLVPLSAVTNLRGKIKELKTELGTTREGAARATQLEQQIQQLQQQVSQMTPLAQAYQAAIAAQQAPRQDPAENTTELVEIARDLDLYATDGKPDIEKARRIRDRDEARAQRVAQQSVAPFQRQTLQQQAATNLARAKITEVNGLKADPAILDALAGKLAGQPGGLETLANPEAMGHILLLAFGAGAASGVNGQPAAQRGPNGQFQPRQATPPPLPVERSGGRAEPAAAPLSAAEERFIKDSGMTAQEYLEASKAMPRSK